MSNIFYEDTHVDLKDDNNFNSNKNIVTKENFQINLGKDFNNNPINVLITKNSNLLLSGETRKGINGSLYRVIKINSLK